MKKISAYFFAAAFVFSAAFAFTSMSKNNDSLIKDKSESKTEKSSAYGNDFRESENESSENVQNISIVEGTILYQGNVPFQYPCIKTPDGKIYTILAEEKAIQEIRKNSSSFFRFEGRIIPNEPGKLSYKGSKDGYFEVRNFEILEQI